MRGSAKSTKMASYRYGKFSEKIATGYLILKGYRIVARNFSSHFGEIDIIAARGRSLAVIEVKARKSGAYEVLTTRQQKRITNAASAFLAQRPEFSDYEIRFDLMAFKPFSIEHIKDCWRP